MAISEFPRASAVYQNKVRCSTFDMEMIFHSHANKTHFHKKCWAPNLVLIQRPGGTRKCPIKLHETGIVDTVAFKEKFSSAGCIKIFHFRAGLRR